jgi:hypothetical protein
MVFKSCPNCAWTCKSDMAQYRANEKIISLALILLERRRSEASIMKMLLKPPKIFAFRDSLHKRCKNDPPNYLEIFV